MVVPLRIKWRKTVQRGQGAVPCLISIFYLSYQLTVNGLVLRDPEMFPAETNSAQTCKFIAIWPRITVKNILKIYFQ